MEITKHPANGSHKSIENGCLDVETGGGSMASVLISISISIPRNTRPLLYEIQWRTNIFLRYMAQWYQVPARTRHIVSRYLLCRSIEWETFWVPRHCSHCYRKSLKQSRCAAPSSPFTGSFSQNNSQAFKVSVESLKIQLR